MLSTGPEALDLLAALSDIERAMGRKRGAGEGERFGPRVIDLDVLLFGNEAIRSGPLILPHPRMRERAFVLVPLADLAPDLAFPDGGTVREALNRLDYRVQGDRIYQPAPERDPAGAARTRPAS